MQKNQGYITLITVLIIAAVALAISTNISLLGIGVAQSSLSNQLGQNALEFSEGCAEDGLLNAQKSNAYSGGNITRPEGACVITVLKNGNNWTIIANGTQNAYNRTVQVQFTRTSGSPITVSSWQETTPYLTPTPTPTPLPTPTPTPTPTPLPTPTPTPTPIPVATATPSPTPTPTLKPTPTPTPTPTPPLNWYSPSWLYRQAITINSSKVGGTLNSFPVFLHLTSNTGLESHAQSSGNDILFTDSSGTTKIPEQIIQYNQGTGVLCAWVQVPTINSSSNTTIYMYYGNPSAGSQQNPTGVWDSNYVGVWHMNESTSNTTVHDSTSYGNNGTSEENTSNVHISGEMGDGFKFNGSSDYVKIPDNSSIQVAKGDLTISVWYYLNVSPNYNTPFDKGVASTQYRDLFWSPNQPYGGWWDLGGTQIGQGWGSTADSWTASGWHYIVIERKSGDSNMYLDGKFEWGVVGLNGNGDTGSPLYWGYNISGGGANWNGNLEEGRLSNTARSAAWIQTEYNDQSSPQTFYSDGNEQDY